MEAHLSSGSLDAISQVKLTTRCRWREEVKSIVEASRESVVTPIKLVNLVGRETPAHCFRGLQMLEQLDQRCDAFNGHLQR